MNLLTGSAATKGVEGEEVAPGDRHSPLLHMWCRHCGAQGLHTSFEMTCTDCVRLQVETGIEDWVEDIALTVEFAKVSEAVSKQATNSFQEFAVRTADLARRTMPAPDSPLSPYQASPDSLTLDELTKVMRSLLGDSPADRFLPAPTSSPRGPFPDAVFHDDLP